MSDIVIRKMVSEDAIALAALLAADDKAYGQFFTPFETDGRHLAQRLASARQDGYWGMWLAEKLIGFFMLRGIDDGYRRPSYGVYISKACSGRGLSQLSLQYCMSWCRLNGVTALMLKVHPENTIALQVYEKHRFVQIGVCRQTHQQMMERRWGEKR